MKNNDEIINLALQSNNWSTNAVFDTKELRSTIEDVILHINTNDFTWSFWVPSKVNLFVWQASLYIISSKSALAKRNILLDSSCQLCDMLMKIQITIFLIAILPSGFGVLYRLGVNYLFFNHHDYGYTNASRFMAFFKRET